MRPNQKTDPERYCSHCKQLLSRKRYRGTLESMNCFLRRKYCNQNCMALAFVKDVPLKSALLKRAKIFRGNSCESCGDTHMVAVHHIDGNRLNNCPENIQTLCVSCHATHHHHAHRAGLTVAGRMASPESPAESRTESQDSKR